VNKPGVPRNEFKRWIFATRNSLAGYRVVFRDEAAFRSQVLALIGLVPLAAWLADSWTLFALLIGCWILVLAGELVNSAIEAVVDRIGSEHHPLSAKAKDAGSALTLTLMGLTAVVWVAVAADRFG